MKYVGENALKKWTSLVKSDIKKKLDKNQGTANSGKILSINTSGEVAPTDTELVDVPNGIVKGDGSTLSAAVAGTDYMAPVTGGTTGQVLTKTTDGQEWQDREKDIFVVTISGNDSSGYTADKTFAEIKAAYDGGKTVVATTVVNNSMTCPLFLVYLADTLVQFTAALFDNASVTLSITMDKNNNIARNLTSNQAVITASGLLKGDGIGGVSAATAGTDYMTPPTGGTAGQILKKTETGTEWADAPVPDWNQNDSTAADYVKNRPFYTGDPVETVLVEESTVAFTENNGLYIAQFPSTFEATVGETYKISWDGTAYECVCASFKSLVLIGNLSIASVGSDTGEPFLMNVDNGQGIQIGTTNSSSSHIISISRTDVPVVKIDKKYLPISFKPDGKSYLTFSSPNSFTLKVSDTTKYWDGTLEYFASDRTWTTWDGTTTLSSVDNYGEYVLYLRGTGNTKIGHYDKKVPIPWVINGTDVRCDGNIENLLDYATVKAGQHPTMADNCYYAMFYGCTSLTQAPALPATTLTEGCYFSMFCDCTALTQAPDLPATTLAPNCYYAMFQRCTSLTQAPALTATTLANYCYSNMFYGCTALTQAQALPATTLAEGCYSNMFQSCTALTQAPDLPATTLAPNCYYAMFQGCTALTQAPALPATTLSDYCYRSMFYRCTSLIQAPALPATTLAESCYNNMFFNCTSLKLSSSKTGEYTQEYRIPSSGTGTTATNALTSMFSSTGGTFTGEPGINTTYYLSSYNMVVHDTEVATLNGYVGSMIKELATQEYVDGKVPDGGTAGQVLTKTADSQQWADAPKSLPDGGTAGDALVKSTDGGSWETPVEASLVDLPVITASQTDLTAGTSPLATGELYVVYE